jgi:hypothetical protein
VKRIDRLLAAVALTVPMVGGVGVAAADSPNAAAGFGTLFHDGETVRTVATPTSMPGRGTDLIYAFPNEQAQGQYAVTAVAPGDAGYHGGKWAVHLISWNVEPYLLTSDEAVAAAHQAGDIDVTRAPQADFQCPVAGKVR